MLRLLEAIIIQMSIRLNLIAILAIYLVISCVDLGRLSYCLLAIPFLTICCPGLCY